MPLKERQEFLLWLSENEPENEDVDSIPGFAQWVKDPMLLWLWPRPAAAAPIYRLARELPYAEGIALKSKKKRKIIFENLIFR